MVDGMTRVGGNQYINSDAVGRYEDHIINELVPFIDGKYKTLGAGHRGVMGKSSGGYGAIIHGMRHADTWSAVACHSGDMYFDYCYWPDFPKAIDGLRATPTLRSGSTSSRRNRRLKRRTCSSSTSSPWRHSTHPVRGIARHRPAV